MRRIDYTQVWIGTPEESDRRDIEFYRNLTPQDRVDMLLEIIHEWTPTSDRRLEKTYRVVEVPQG